MHQLNTPTTIAPSAREIPSAMYGCVVVAELNGPPDVLVSVWKARTMPPITPTTAVMIAAASRNLAPVVSGLASAKMRLAVSSSSSPSEPDHDAAYGTSARASHARRPARHFSRNAS